ALGGARRNRHHGVFGTGGAGCGRGMEPQPLGERHPTSRGRRMCSRAPPSEPRPFPRIACDCDHGIRCGARAGCRGGLRGVLWETGAGGRLRQYGRVPRSQDAAQLTRMSGNKSILIVDDENDFRAAVATFLEGAGYRVVEAEHGEAALSSLRSPTEFCLILLDLFMPVMNGWSFRAEQRKDPKVAGIPIVVITAAHYLTRAAAQPA